MELTAEDIKKYNYHYDIASELTNQVIILDNVIVERTEENIAKAQKGIAHYKECLAISNQWVARFFLGKIYQWLGQNGNAMHQFLPAMDLEQENAELANEASLSAVRLGDVEFALELSAEANRRKSNNPKYLSNHALNLLLNKKDDEALKWSAKAIELDNEDVINKKVHQLIKGVINGDRKRPVITELQNW